MENIYIVFVQKPAKILKPKNSPKIPRIKLESVDVEE